LLDLMGAGRSAAEAVADIVGSEALIEYRQLTAIDEAGGVGSFSGGRTLGCHAVANGVDAVAAGNLLAQSDVPEAMVAAFEADPEAELEERLLAAVGAGIAAGGEAGPVHSAGMVIVGDVAWRTTDLRVDWSDDPVADLGRLWSIWKPQKADYLQRAIDPGAAPSYGVPGDSEG
jgi:uncharacterized Ntn-hydrolase superfamily protein